MEASPALISIDHQEDIFEQDREDALSPSDKATCQKL